MKVLIISDIHDNLVALNKALAIGTDVSAEAIICCGDISNLETVSVLDGIGLPVYVVRGNCELFTDQDLLVYKNIKYLGRYGVLEIASHQIGICHEPFFIDNVMELAGDKHCEIIFFGHTHKPWEDKKKMTRLINPGTLSGMFMAGTFAIWNTDNNEMELKMVN